MRNFLFSTTRQWNPGDEFILMGIRRLFEEAGFAFNPIIYNRNPEVTQPRIGWNPLRRLQRPVRGQRLLSSFLRLGFYDNSFKLGMDGDFIDLAVFAGTPGWFEGSARPLYEAIEQHRIPTLFLGIGSAWSAADLASYIDDPLILKVLSKALLITVRDPVTHEVLSAMNLHPIQLPCPAIFAAARTRKIKRVESIGLIYSARSALPNQRVDEAVHGPMVELFDRIRKRYSPKMHIEFVAHYIDDLPEFRRTFTDNPSIHYSYDARDYLEIYRHFDLVAGARVHGIGLAASLGIPGIYFGHDDRRGTVEGFKSPDIDLRRSGGVDRAMALFETSIESITARHAELIQHKQYSKNRYLDLIRDHLGSSGADPGKPGVFESPGPDPAAAGGSESGGASESGGGSMQ